MGEYKTPGVYIKEKNAFPNSVVEASTAIPAFIGITEKAQNGSENLNNKPWKIASMTEFVKFFGGAPKVEFEVNVVQEDFEVNVVEENEGDSINLSGDIKEPKFHFFRYDINSDKENKKKYVFCLSCENIYTLYYNMLLFFANGGGTCYVVSVGTYGVQEVKVTNALDNLKKEQEVTMIIVPEAVEDSKMFPNIQQMMLKHCGEMANRIAILDISSKYSSNAPLKRRIETFQEGIGSNYLSYGAVYYPWLNTSVLGDRDLTGEMFIWTKQSIDYLDKFLQVDEKIEAIVENFAFITLIVEKDHSVTIGGKDYAWDDIKTDKLEKDLNTSVKVTLDDKAVPNKKSIKYYSISDKKGLHLALLSGSVLYQQAIKEAKKYLNRLPPSAALAGIYTMVDKTRGVWKAPANVSVNYVDSPVEDIDDDVQAELNAPMNGKAINVIRTFQGEGVKVWGARTLDGNSLDWRYVNVRRTLLFLEESVKNAARAYVFEPNDAGTWINMKCMIENFLRSVWKRGGLAGATPEDAFNVYVGLGDTMTPDDILEGIMRITVLVAVSHPAEFIEITFQQQMQKS